MPVSGGYVLGPERRTRPLGGAARPLLEAESEALEARLERVFHSRPPAGWAQALVGPGTLPEDRSNLVKTDELVRRTLAEYRVAIRQIERPGASTFVP